MSTNKPVVAVVGLGAIGSMTLMSLAQRGVDVVGIDRLRPGDDDGAYGGGTRQVRLAGKGEHAAEHVAWVRESLSLWSRFEADADERFYIPTGNLSVGPPEDPDVSGVALSLEAEGLDHLILSPAEVAKRFPQHRLSSDEIGVFAVDGGVLRSNLAVRTAVSRAQRLGASTEWGDVTHIEQVGDNVNIDVNGKRITVDQVVVAGGPWTSSLIPSLGSVITPRVVPSVWVEPAPGTTFDPATFPPGVRRSREGFSYTFLPAVAGTAAKFVHWDPMRPTVEHWDQVDRTVDDSIVRATRESLRRTLSGAGVVHESRSYVDGFTPDRWPLVGKPTEAITVLSGFSGGGFGISPLMGEIAADLATKGSTEWDLSSVSLERGI